MSEATKDLEQRVFDVRRRREEQAAQDVEERDLERQLQVSQEADARTAAEKYLLAHARGVGSLVAQLEETLNRLRENPNAKDVEKANGTWANICARVELADVVQRRFADIKMPKLPAVIAPGMRKLGIEGLSTRSPRSQLFPLVTASDSAELRTAVYALAAFEYLQGIVATVDADLRLAATVRPPTPNYEERRVRQRAESAKARGMAGRPNIFGG